MPILYGKGQNAFKRLQLEIIASSCDHSIFAWVGDDKGDASGGLLASYPAQFQYSGNMSRKLPSNKPFSMTNNGLQHDLPLMAYDKSKKVYVALNCHRSTSPDFIGIYLRELQETPLLDSFKEDGIPYLQGPSCKPDQFERIHLDDLYQGPGIQYYFKVTERNILFKEQVFIRPRVDTENDYPQIETKLQDRYDGLQFIVDSYYTIYWRWIER